MGACNLMTYCLGPYKNSGNARGVLDKHAAARAVEFAYKGTCNLGVYILGPHNWGTYCLWAAKPGQ